MTDLSSIDFPGFAALIEDTFDAQPSSIERNTRCGDVPGWDSLGHSVLLARLDRRLGAPLSEADAAPAETVGELFERVSAVRAKAGA